MSTIVNGVTLEDKNIPFEFKNIVDYIETIIYEQVQDTCTPCLTKGSANYLLTPVRNLTGLTPTILGVPAVTAPSGFFNPNLLFNQSMMNQTANLTGLGNQTAANLPTGIEGAGAAVTPLGAGANATTTTTPGNATAAPSGAQNATGANVTGGGANVVAPGTTPGGATAAVVPAGTAVNATTGVTNATTTPAATGANATAPTGGAAVIAPVGGAANATTAGAGGNQTAGNATTTGGGAAAGGAQSPNATTPGALNINLVNNTARAGGTR